MHAGKLVFAQLMEHLSGKAAVREWVFWLVAAMLAITLLLQFGIQPLMAEIKLQIQPLDVMQSALAGRFKMWHGISSILYLVESLFGAALVIKGASKGVAKAGINLG